MTILAQLFVVAICFWSGISTANIYGADDRQLVPEAKRFFQPWRYIGKLSTRSTGTLVGRDLVLTCAHCVYDLPGKHRRADLTTFSLTLIGGRASVTAKVVEIYSDDDPSSERRETDWAIVRLDQPLGDKFGWLDLDTEYLYGEGKLPLRTAGHSSDMDGGGTLWHTANCELQLTLPRRLFIHDCDIVPGASGGPVYVTQPAPAGHQFPWILRVVGINVGIRGVDGDPRARLPKFDPRYPNYGLGARAFAEKLQELRGGR